MLVAGIGVYVATRGGHRLPAPGSAAYEETVRTFYRALGSLEVGLLDDARREFSRATELAEAEPAAWANLGLADARLGNFDEAAGPLARAAELAPDSSRVALAIGQMEAARGRVDQAIEQLQRAVDLDSRNLHARFALAEQFEAQGGPDADARAAQQLDELSGIAPDNLVVLLEGTRLAIKRSDAAAARDLAAQLDERQAGEAWPARAVEESASLQRAIDAQDFAAGARAVAFLRNLLAPTPAFQDSLAAVRPEPGLIAEPLTRFLTLPAPSPSPSPPDRQLTFAEETFDTSVSPVTTLIAFSPDGAAPPVVMTAGASGVRRIDGAEPSTVLPGAVASLAALDWDNDFRMDLVAAGPGGVRLLLQAQDGTFTDATAAALAADGPLNSDCVGAWAADIEMDGDLDIVAGVRNGPPVVLRNNGDGTWRRVQPFPGISSVVGFAWADLDLDADPDAAMLDADGVVHLFENRQAGDLRPMFGLPAAASSTLEAPTIALALGDTDADGVFDLVTLDAAGNLRRLWRENEAFRQERLATWPGGNLQGAAAGSYRLFVEDLDNSGALDVAASGPAGTAIWLGGDESGLLALPSSPDAEVFSVADFNGDGSLDLAGVSEGRAVRLIGQGRAGYHWQVVRPRALAAAGDQRINSFGVGGEIEIRSGLLVQTQIIGGSPVHFGLGTHTGFDVARILWPNGVTQAEFDRPADQVMAAEQRLKGSCPWVFAYDGRGMRFVTDFLWRSPLGLRINAQDTAGTSQTEDWVKIRGDQLAPRDGFYDVRITAELWETHFVDHVSLMVVDHPADVAVFVDERFAKTPPALTIHATNRPRAVAGAWDDRGRTVTNLIARRDGVYVNDFALGRYQGIGADHFIELDIGSRTPRPEWLVANGWIYPTDSSINVAIGQGRHPQPRGIGLEAQDESGRWVVVADDLGFPAGKNKTILIDLKQLAAAGVAGARRIRLRTNLEIYWDWIALAEAADSGAIETRRLQPSSATLRYRGYSETTPTRREAPETPDYDRIANVTQRWRDLAGYYTRFGDVRELLAKVEDRYVIMNAGDELQLRFEAAAPPSNGWVRDFVLIGDGWEKDGDYNTAFSSTVRPLPSHESPDYKGPAEGAGLEDDPIYRRYETDWATYHTRFVAPRRFVRGLRSVRP